MRPPVGSLLLAAAAAAFGIWAFVERAPHMMDTALPEAVPATPGVASLPPGPQARWAVDPADPGPDLPSTGRSLFDFATIQRAGDKASYDIPFPFEALVHRIEERAGCLGRNGSCIQQVLIPLGRSLQRVAASPDFFAFPRVVIAVDGEGPSGMLLKDRLYVGYQERSNLLEVISYNEAAGRFEFQLVKDYRSGGSPRPVYASRNVCIACHQNLAPLFSRPQWDETNANPAVAQQLSHSRNSFYGFPGRRGIETPGAIDSAIHRANMLSVYQTLWREGCGEDPVRAAACRRAVVIAALQYRLSGERAFDAAAPALRTAAIAVLADASRARWPAGLAIPNPEIPNRNALDRLGGASGLAMAHVPARFEPLAARAPLDVWPADGEQLTRRLVLGLAQFFSEQDMDRLDQRLAQMAEAAHAPSHDSSLGCRIDTPGDGVRFVCRDSADGEARLEGRVNLRGGRIEAGELAALALTNEAPVHLLEVKKGALTRTGRFNILVFKPSLFGGRGARLGSGNAIEQIKLRWSADGKGDAVVSVVEDFKPLGDAIQALAANQDNGALDANAFARANIMSVLDKALALPPQTQSCCTRGDGFPLAQADVDASASADVPAIADPFKAACGRCHRTPETSPPNFLYGDPQRVSAAITSCATRMFVRLSMWDLAAAKREKTPMPPTRASNDGMPPDHEYGPKPEALAALKQAVVKILRKETGVEPSLQHLLEGGYESLPPCLPAGA